MRRSVRVDSLPMLRRSQAAGGDGAVLLRQEVEPNNTLLEGRRTGSVREARRGRALGAVMDGAAITGRWFNEAAISLGADQTLGFSVHVGDILEATGSVPLVSLKRSDGDAFEVLLIRDAAGLKLQAKLTEGGGSNVSVNSGVCSAGDDIHVALRFTTSTKLVEMDTTGDLTTDVDVSGAALTLAGTNYRLSVLGDGYGTTAKPLHRSSVVSNFVRYNSRVSDISTFLNTRTPSGSPVDHYKLQGNKGLFDSNDGSSTDILMAHPSEPQLASNLLLFNGTSSAERVELVTEIEQLFATKIRSVSDNTFSLYMKGTRRKTDTGEEVLWHFGDLAKVTIAATTGFVSFVLNGTTVSTSTATILADQAFEVYALRDGTTVTLKVIASSTETTTTTDSALLSPTLDFARIPKLWVGSDEDPSTSTQFGGSVEVFALFKEAVLFNPGPGPAAIFYVDTASVSDGLSVEDQGPLSVGITPTAHSTIDANPGWAPGPFKDAEHVAVCSGEVVTSGEVVSYDPEDQRFSKKLATDAASIRFGQHTIVASGNRLHILDSRRKTVRPMGIPKPSAEVSTLSVAPGVLGGAVSYGYRSVTRDGTYGPLRRLDPVIAENAAKILLGSSNGEGGDLDAELGETFAQTQTSGQSRVELATAGGDPFSGNDELPVSVHARVKGFDIDDIEELIWSRGLRNENTSDRMHFTTKQTSLGIDVNSNWTLQASFRYVTSPSSSQMRGQCVAGIAKHEGRRTGTGSSVNNADFVGIIHDGGHTDMEADGAGYAPYGKTSPRLAVYLSRQEWFQQYGSSDNFYIANYKPLTFTNDSSLWTSGNDYSIYFQRQGDKLNVWVHDRTAKTFTQLTARSMSALSAVTAYGPSTRPAIAAYDGDSFFSGWQPSTNSRAIVFGGGQDFFVQVPFLVQSTGQADQTDYGVTFSTFDRATWNKVYNQGGSVVHYHYRFWGRAVNSNDLENYGEERFAAQDSGALNHDCLYDFGCLLEDVSQTEDKTGDGLASAVQWYAQGEDRSTETFEHFEQDVSGEQASVQPLVLFSHSSVAMVDAPLALYVSTLGNGRLVVQASNEEGSYVLTNKLWPGSLFNPVRVKRLEDFDTFVNNFDEFNWYTLALSPKSSGGGKAFQVTGMAINGNTLFDQSIGGNSTPVTTWTSPWIWLGGHADNTTNAYQAEIGEFRLWDDDQGPNVDNGTGFDYLVGRVPSSELANLLVYAKMQPSDEYNGGDGKATGTNQLYQYGSLSDEFVLQDGTGRAVIYDSRTETQGGSDPAPQISFPENPREDIVAYELTRSRFVPLTDYNDEEERQSALDTARGLPQFVRARVPVGTTHFLDNSPDETLGESVQFEDHSTPPVALQTVVWQGQLGVVTDNRRVFFSEPGPFGWETFPTQLIYQARAEGSGGSDVTCGQSTGSELYLFGSDWASAVVGSPGSEDEISLGNGIGSYSARTAVTVSGQVYAFNGRLWRVDRVGQVDFKVEDVGFEVQDLLPTGTDVRLCVSRDLASIYVVDESTGDTVRLHLPTGTFSKEKRDAIAVGDDSSNVANWITLDGAYAKENAGTYADDVESTSSTKSSSGTIASDVFTASLAPTDIHIGMRVGVVDSAGATADGRITAVAGATITLTSGDLSSLADGAGTIYYGASAEGWIIDSGYVDTGNDNTMLRHVHYATQAGNSLQYGVAASPVTGVRSAISDVQFGDMTENIGAAGMRGRFIRVLARDRVPEKVSLTYLSADLELADA